MHLHLCSKEGMTVMQGICPHTKEHLNCCVFNQTCLIMSVIEAV